MSEERVTRDASNDSTVSASDQRADVSNGPQCRFVPGSTIGHYEVLESLGQGGMGEVYLARDTRLGRRVALKFLLQVNPRLSARFWVEARATAQLAHENIVSLYDIAEYGGLPYMVLEYVPGKTLSMWLRERRAGDKIEPVPPLQAVEIMLPVARALQCAHEAGIVHRDLKPANIMLTKSGSVKVLDFGVAKLLGDNEKSPAHVDAAAKNSAQSIYDALAMADLTETGVMVGTRAYMAPEQWWGEIVDGRADIWAVGIMLYQMITGLHPLAPLSPEALVSVADRDKKMPSVLDVVPSLGDIGMAIDRCLLKKKDERWASAHELCEALEKCCRQSWATHLGQGTRDITGELRSQTARAIFGTKDAPSDSQSQMPKVLVKVEQSLSTPEGMDKTAEAPSQVAVSLLESSEASGTANAALPTAPPKIVLPSKKHGPIVLLAAAMVALGMSATMWARWPAGDGPRANASATAGAPACVGSHCTASKCSSHEECNATREGQPSLCRKETGACVPLEVPGCRVLADPQEIKNEATIWIGAMYPFGPRGSTYGQQAARAVELAYRDFKDIGGIPAVAPGTKPRPLAVVLCDDTEDQSRIARHLVDAVNVPVILGFARSKEVMDLATEFFLPKGVLALASNTASSLVDIPHPTGSPRLVLRVTTSANMVNRPKTAFLEEYLEPLLRKRSVVNKAEPMRIALIRANNASGLSHTDDLISSLRWNGKNAVENGDLVQQFVVPDELERKDKPDTLHPVADAIAKFAPHLVIETGADMEPILHIERRWLSTTKFRPTYLLGGMFGSPSINTLLREQPDAVSRLFNVSNAITSIHKKFIMHYNEIFTDEKISTFKATTAPYDAFYAAAYTMIALGDAPMNGKSLSQAIQRIVPPGETIEVGPASIYKATKLLREGKNIDLAGAQTSLDFDPQTGDPTAEFSVQCMDGSQNVAIESGLIFEAKSGKFTGTFRCP